MTDGKSNTVAPPGFALKTSVKRPLHLLGQAVLLVIAWAVIFEIGCRLQQYFGPLYDLEMANVNLNWESDAVNHQPTPENQSAPSAAVAK